MNGEQNFPEKRDLGPKEVLEARTEERGKAGRGHPGPSCVDGEQDRFGSLAGKSERQDGSSVPGEISVLYLLFSGETFPE